jgi:capsular polysaccharide biosynthesis protein
MENLVDTKKIIAVLRKSWWVFAVCIIYGAVMGILVTSKQKPVYRAQTTLMVGQLLDATQLNRDELQVTDALAQTYAQMVRRQGVMQNSLDHVPVNVGWQDLSKKVDVSVVEGTQLFEVGVDWGDPFTAQALAEEIARQTVLLGPSVNQNTNSDSQTFIRQEISNLQTMIESGQERLRGLEAQLSEAPSETERAGLQGQITSLQNLLIGWQNTYTQMLEHVNTDTSPNKLSVIEPAYVDPEPVWPRKEVNALFGAGLGLLLASAFIFYSEFFQESLISMASEGAAFGVPQSAANGHQPAPVLTIAQQNAASTGTSQLLSQLQQHVANMGQDLEKLELLSLQDAAGYLSMDVSDTFHMLQESEVPVIQLGSVFRVRRDDLDAYLSNNKLDLKKG